MADILDSIVVDFGEEASEDDVSATLINDDYQNRIEQGITDGTVSPNFIQNIDFHILCQLPVGFGIESIISTDSQVIQNGVVSRTHTMERTFFPDESKQNLSPYSSAGTVTAAAYGRSSTFTVTEYKEIVANTPPVIADITYPYTAYSLTIKAIDIADYPIGIVIYARKL